MPKFPSLPRAENCFNADTPSKPALHLHAHCPPWSGQRRRACGLFSGSGQYAQLASLPRRPRRAKSPSAPTVSACSRSGRRTARSAASTFPLPDSLREPLRAACRRLGLASRLRRRIAFAACVSSGAEGPPPGVRRMAWPIRFRSTKKTTTEGQASAPAEIPRNSRRQIARMASWACVTTRGGTGGCCLGGSGSAVKDA